MAIFARNKTTGVLTQLPAPTGCLDEGGDGVTYTDAIGLDDATSVIVSPNGNHVYVAASSFFGGVTVFARNKTTGALTQLPAPNGCINQTGNGGACIASPMLDNAQGVTMSQNGKHLYVVSAGADAVLTFTRDKTTGVLAQLPAPSGCIADMGKGVTCTDGVGLNGPQAVAVSKDGKHVYAVSGESDAVTVFAREK